MTMGGHRRTCRPRRHVSVEMQFAALNEDWLAPLPVETPPAADNGIKPPKPSPVASSSKPWHGSES